MQNNRNPYANPLRFEWQMISAPEFFDRMLWYNVDTGIYECDNKVVDTQDCRLIAYLEACKTMVPKCPHRGYDISQVSPDKNGIITCPLHGLKFGTDGQIIKNNN